MQNIINVNTKLNDHVTVINKTINKINKQILFMYWYTIKYF